MIIKSLEFVKSASKLAECPAPDFAEIAVIGRSNVGKSTLINMLMQKPIAKSSDKPGKTQLINYFLVNENWYFVDLPGYGYAKASLESRRKWIDETYEYFIDRKPLILVLIDGNIPPQKIDLEFWSPRRIRQIKRCFIRILDFLSNQYKNKSDSCLRWLFLLQ